MSDSTAMGSSQSTTNSAGDTTLPPELLQEIFVNLPAHQVVRVCPLVCREWRALVNSECLWKERCRREGYKPGDEAGQDVVKGWKMFYFLSKDKRNLLKNTKAEEGLKYWNILSNKGDGWVTEEVRSPHPNEGTTQTFVSSYGPCIKSQLIDLRKEGYNHHIMDKFQPDIRISDCCASKLCSRYAPRFDCACEYEIRVELLDKKKDALQAFSPEKVSFEQWNDEKWNKMTHVFRKYGQGVRYVKFVHGGNDRQYWKGWYGIRVTDSCVEIGPPEDR
ncbi:F-box only protein 6 isoform X1 [Gadus morhua]|uniref:F-box only protein 6 isoform X1 n=1 Tax=Gadus morhua TaxID=8049 RepID=UPI0011B76B28|nr:F-box only protein 6-like isoform X1 [Gadus morhua]